MTLTISVVAVLGVLVILLCRYAGLRIWHALICITLGFYLASSSLAGEIHQITHDIGSHTGRSCLTRLSAQNESFCALAATNPYQTNRH